MEYLQNKRGINMPRKELKKIKNNGDTNEILLAINENIGIAILEVCSELKKIKETQDDILRELKRKRRD